MKRFKLAAVAVTLTGAVGIATLGAGSAPAQSAKTVNITDNRFSIKTVKKGTTLKFVWKGRAPHDVKGAGLNSGRPVVKRKPYTKKVTRTGTIICSIHSEMKIRVTR